MLPSYFKIKILLKCREYSTLGPKGINLTGPSLLSFTPDFLILNIMIKYLKLLLYLLWLLKLLENWIAKAVYML